MPSLFLLGLLFVASAQAPSPQAPPRAAAAVAAADDLSAEVQRAVAAYNARDLSYYESVLDPKSVYIAEDGAVISGRERVLRTFGRIFTADPPRRIEISDLTVDRRGDTGWATFRWTLTAGADARHGRHVGPLRPRRRRMAPDAHPEHAARACHAPGRGRLALAQPFAALTAGRP